MCHNVGCEATSNYNKILQSYEQLSVDPSSFSLEDFMKCKYCDFTCSNADIHRKHIKKEHRNKCDKCYITFKDIEAKNLHMWDIHNNNNKSYPQCLVVCSTPL